MNSARKSPGLHGSDSRFHFQEQYRQNRHRPPAEGLDAIRRIQLTLEAVYLSRVGDLKSFRKRTEEELHNV